MPDIPVQMSVFFYHSVGNAVCVKAHKPFNIEQAEHNQHKDDRKINCPAVFFDNKQIEHAEKKLDSAEHQSAPGTGQKTAADDQQCGE